LLNYYGEPEWQPLIPPLDLLIATIISQNTNDKNRDIAFQRLKERFPNWKVAAESNVAEIISAIRPAGLALQKAQRIKELLNDILANAERMRLKEGEELDFLKLMNVEDAKKWLLSHKGIGPKTAAIVMLFSLDMPAFPVDTHVYRVTGRLGLRSKQMNIVQTHEFLESIFQREVYAAVHLNLIRLGREICQARKTFCERCPLNELCETVKNR